MNIFEEGRVVALEADGAWVETMRSSACGSCAARSGCGHRTLAGVLTRDKGLVRARGSRALNAGECAINDKVEISIPRATLAQGALLLYGGPLAFGTLLAFFAGTGSDLLAALSFFAGLGLAFGVLRWLTSMGLFGSVEPQLERIVERFTETSPIIVTAAHAAEH
ncbi:SoxR reducing system RseC family protein [Luminiphilus sp.]|nr:SoxR reducing system RseC family protein [Luminiphilus sp.]